METNTITPASYLDILFQRRNKMYGSYELRTNYNRRARKAALIAISSVAALFCCSFAAIHSPSESSHTTMVTKVCTLELIENTVKPPVVPPAPKQVLPPAPPKPMKTSHFAVPDVVQDLDVKPDQTMATTKDLSNSQIGPNNADGDSTDLSIVTTTTHTTGTTGVVTTSTPSTQPMRYVTQMPQFPSDLYAYISSHIQYPDAAREAGITGRVTVEFVVNENGSVSDMKIIKSIGGGCDESTLRMVAAMPRWKPGKQNGTPVKVYYTLPVTFELD